MKNTNPLFLIEKMITSEQLRGMKNLKKDFFGAKQVVKKAKEAAKDYNYKVKSGKIKEKVSSVPRNRRHRESNSGIKFTSIFGSSSF